MTNEIEQAIFQPRKAAKTLAPDGAENIDLPLVDLGIRLGGRLYKAGNDRPNIVFFHSIAEIVPDYDSIGPRFATAGVNFIISDYRGYGWSEGVPGIASLLPDARAAFSFLETWLKEHDCTGPIAVMGRSLGSACALEVASAFPDKIRALVIESGFARFLPSLQKMGVPAEILAGMNEQHDPFANVDKIQRVGKSTLILHGQQDRLTELWQAELLHAESPARTKELQVVPGADHKTVIEKGGDHYFRVIADFVIKACGMMPSWRDRRRALKATEAEK